MTQTKSKQRIADHGEVFTAKREVNAMLDLVEAETRRIDSRFLEPACGCGNFLTQILERKLTIVHKRYQPDQHDFERYCIIAIASIYGIDILEDNVIECRDNLFNIFNKLYTKLYQQNTKDKMQACVKFILNNNIIHGDALSLTTISDIPKPIIFTQLCTVNGSMIQMHDFCYKSMIEQALLSELPLFSDMGEQAYIPTPVKSYPVCHFLELTNVSTN